MHKRLIKRPLKAKLGLSGVPFLEQFMGSSGMNVLDKYKGEAGKQMLKQQGFDTGSQLVDFAGAKATNAINRDFHAHNPAAGSIQNMRGEALGMVGGALGGPAGQFAGKVISKTLDMSEAALAKDDCAVDPITGDPMIDEKTGICLKKKNALDALSMTGNIQDTIGAVKNIGKGHGFGAVASSFAAATPLGKILGVNDRIQDRAINQRTIASLNQYDLNNQLNQNKAAAMSESQRLQRVVLNPAFGTYAKKGAMIPEKSNCGCNKDKDGLDTDIFYSMPRKLFNQVLKRINLPEGTPYNNKVKTLLKNSVPEKMTLKEYVGNISPEIKKYINQ